MSSFFFNSSSTTTTINNNAELIKVLESNNISEIKKKITIVNANNVLNKRNWFSLHYAIIYNLDKEIIKYLMSITILKTSEEKELDLFALKHDNINYFDCIKEKNNSIINETKVLETKNLNLTDTVNYLNDTIKQHTTNIKNLKEEKNKINEELIKLKENKIILNQDIIKSKKENEELKNENAKLKRKVIEGETAFSNLLKKQKK